jgi:hypothetical protein
MFDTAIHNARTLSRSAMIAILSRPEPFAQSSSYRFSPDTPFSNMDFARLRKPSMFVWLPFTLKSARLLNDIR